MTTIQNIQFNEPTSDFWFDFTDAAELDHLSVDDCTEEILFNMTGRRDFDAPDFLDSELTLPAAELPVEVEHSIWAVRRGVAQVEENTVRGFLKAVDTALSRHLTETELFGGRSCFFEDVNVFFSHDGEPAFFQIQLGS